MPPRMFYTNSVTPDFGLPWPRYELRDESFYANLTDEQVAEEARVKTQMENNAVLDMQQFGWTLEGWREVMDNWKKYTTHCIFGGNRCLRGDTQIFDPYLGEYRRIDQIDGPFHVYAWDGLNLVMAEASKPFTKGQGLMLRVNLENGASFVAAPEHQIYADGTWRAVRELTPGCELFQPRTIWDIYQSVHAAGVRRSTGTQPDSLVGYHPADRSCDAPLLSGEDIGPVPSRLRGGAPRHIFAYDNIPRWLWRLVEHLWTDRLGGRDRKPLYSQAERSPFLRSIWDGLHPRAARCADILYRVSCIPYKATWRLFAGQVPPAKWRLLVGFRPQRYGLEFLQRDNRCNGHSWVMVKSIEREETAVKWDITVPAHGNYWCAGVLHHNSGKSVFCSRLMLHLLQTIPEARIRLYHVNDEKSISEQQQIIWEALPERYKTLSKRKGIYHSIVFSQKTGFTGNKLILPPQPGYTRGSEMTFGTYEQYRNNPQVVEGWWAHAIWGDEEMPQKMYERLLTRLYDTRGRLVLSFTTVQGWSPLVADILGRTKTLRKRYSTLLKREIPVAQESLSRASTRIYYFWTQDNPFIPSDAVDALKGRPQEEILAIAHGIPSRPALGKFPRFDELVHVLPHEKLPWLLPVKDGFPIPEFTRYCVIDPSGSKPWAIGWFAVSANDCVYLYRESPDISFGTWAEPSATLEGKPGPAAKPNGFGINDYVELLKHEETGEEIFERIIDPRLGAALTQSKEGATSIITELEEAGIHVIAAPGLMIDHGLQLINNRLAYDAAQPVSALNTPHFFISDRCEQTLYAFKNYTAQGGPTEACKDWIDLPRYLFEHGADFISKDAMKTTSVGVPY